MLSAFYHDPSHRLGPTPMGNQSQKYAIGGRATQQMYRTTNQQPNDQPWVAQRPAHNLVRQSGTGRTESTGVRQFSGQRPSLAASTRLWARVCRPPTQRRRKIKCFREGPQTPWLLQTQRYFEGRRNRRTPNATVKRPTGFCAVRD